MRTKVVQIEEKGELANGRTIYTAKGIMARMIVIRCLEDKSTVIGSKSRCLRKTRDSRRLTRRAEYEW